MGPHGISCDGLCLTDGEFYDLCSDQHLPDGLSHAGDNGITLEVIEFAQQVDYVHFVSK